MQGPPAGDAELKKALTEYVNIVEHLKELLDKCRSSSEKSTKELEETKKQLSSANEKIASSDGKYQSLQKELETLRKDSSSSDVRIKEASTRASMAEEKSKGLTSEIEKQKQKISQLEKELTQSKSEAINVNKEDTEELQKCRQKIKDLEHELSALKQTSNNSNSSLQEEVKRLQIEKQQTQEQLSKTQSMLTTAEQNSSHLRTQLTTLQRQSQDRERSLQDELADLRKLASPPRPVEIKPPSRRVSVNEATPPPKSPTSMDWTPRSNVPEWAKKVHSQREDWRPRYKRATTPPPEQEPTPRADWSWFHIPPNQDDINRMKEEEINAILSPAKRTPSPSTPKGPASPTPYSALNNNRSQTPTWKERTGIPSIPKTASPPRRPFQPSDKKEENLSYFKPTTGTQRDNALISSSLDWIMTDRRTALNTTQMLRQNK